MRNTFRSLTALTLALGVVLITQAQDVTGAGASFPAPLYSKWAADYYKATGNKVNYQSVGSGAGIKQIDAKTVDFGASDMPLKDEELAQKNQLQFPTVIGGVVPVVNIRGVAPGALVLDGQTLANIYLGNISNWNDPAIKKLNPKLKLAAAPIVVVHRADGSGTTFIFTNYLSKVSAEWKDKAGNNTSVKWPAGVAGKGETLDIIPRYLIQGRRVAGSSFGGVKGRDQVPALVQRALDGDIDVASFVSHRMGLDVWEVIDAAKTKPFGFMPFYPGPGLGGHCIPIDPFYLSWKARQSGFECRFIELAGHVNRSMPEFVVEKVGEALNTRKKAINGARVHVFGVAYKKDIADMRESPALDVIEILEKRGAVISYSDPYVPHLTFGHLELDAVPEAEAGAGVDIAVICTNHGVFDYAGMPSRFPLVLDTRNALKGVTAPLKFTGELLADIYLGKVKTWNDPAIVADNTAKTTAAVKSLQKKGKLTQDGEYGPKSAKYLKGIV